MVSQAIQSLNSGYFLVTETMSENIMACLSLSWYNLKTSLLTGVYHGISIIWGQWHNIQHEKQLKIILSAYMVKLLII